MATEGWDGDPSVIWMKERFEGWSRTDHHFMQCPFRLLPGDGSVTMVSGRRKARLPWILVAKLEDDGEMEAETTTRPSWENGRERKERGPELMDHPRRKYWVKYPGCQGGRSG